MNKVTLDQVVSWGPCYRLADDSIDVERLLQISGGRTEMTPLELAALDIPPEDRLWLLLHPEIIPEKELHLLACDYAELALPIYEGQYPGDYRPRAAIETKRRWVRGEATDDELEDAACNATHATHAARSAACNAAYAAYAATHAARKAADATYAAYAAADAAYAAADAAAWGKSLEMAVEVLKRLATKENEQ